MSHVFDLPFGVTNQAQTLINDFHKINFYSIQYLVFGIAPRVWSHMIAAITITAWGIKDTGRKLQIENYLQILSIKITDISSECAVIAGIHYVHPSHECITNETIYRDRVIVRFSITQTIRVVFLIHRSYLLLFVWYMISLQRLQVPYLRITFISTFLYYLLLLSFSLTVLNSQVFSFGKLDTKTIFKSHIE